MQLETIVRELNLKVSCAEGTLKREVKGGYVGDLLSDVMANSKEGDILDHGGGGTRTSWPWQASRTSPGSS